MRKSKIGKDAEIPIADYFAARRKQIKKAERIAYLKANAIGLIGLLLSGIVAVTAIIAVLR